MKQPERVAIRSIAGGGDGVGTLADGRTVFVPRAAPGDLIELSRVQLHRRFARARIGRLIESAADRIDPVCPHYERDDCGGCQLMHLDITGQLEAKSRIVGDALRRIAKLDIGDPVIHSAVNSLGYRSKVSFSIADGVIGYHRLGRAGRLLEVERCELAAPELARIHQLIREGRRLLPAAAKRLVLRLGNEGRIHVVVETGPGDSWTTASELAALLGDEVVLWWQPEGGVARVLAGDEDTWPATVFEQVNPEVGSIVRATAVEALLHGVDQPTQIWDLYAGLGDTTLALAAAGHTVESIELDQRAVSLAEARGPAGPRRLVGDVALRMRELGPADLAITNPPREGMAAEVTSLLVTSPVKRIVYVSCDPATLSRDIKRIAEAFTLVGVEAWDQFPQTAHVETVVVLERR